MFVIRNTESRWTLHLKEYPKKSKIKWSWTDKKHEATQYATIAEAQKVKEKYGLTAMRYATEEIKS